MLDAMDMHLDISGYNVNRASTTAFTKPLSIAPALLAS
jgi:hypothetical protein